MKRRAAKRDDNELSIVQGLRAAGAFVQALDVIDLLVGYRGYWYLMEVKDSDKPLTKRRLTFDEMQFVVNVKNRAPVHVVETLEQALTVIRGEHGR